MAHKSMNTSVVKTLAIRKKETDIRRANKVMPQAQPKKQPNRILPPELAVNVGSIGAVTKGVGGPPGKRLMTRIHEIMQERSLQPQRDKKGNVLKDAKGNIIYCQNTRFDDVADAFVRQCESGNFSMSRN